jgi:2-polyprenyl-3-methyl-5-hydroxy-6-metoxy-1,4-benzoquinol methylase
MLSLRMVFSGRLLKRVKVFSQYFYYMTLQAISPALSLEHPKIRTVNGGRGKPPTDRTASIELYLETDTRTRKQFEPPNIATRALATNIPNKFRTTQCFVCDGPLTPVIQIVNAEDTSDYLERSWCRSCDHLQYSMLPPKSWFNNWYSSHWDTETPLSQKLDIRHPTYRYCQRLAPYIGDRKLKILDIGAGYGEKTTLFQKAGHELHCTEASSARANYLRSSVTKNVYFGTLDNPEVQQALRRNGPFDLIFTYHVVEHIYNPRAELQFLREIAAPDAIFYLAIPELYKEGVFQHLYSLEHIASFSRTSAKTLLQQTGFKPIVAKNDLFQTYSNCCQYLIGRRDNSEFAPPMADGDDGRMVKFLTARLSFDRIIGLSGSTVTYSCHGREDMTYLVSADSKHKCQDIAQHLPLRIYHTGLPLFWIY